MLDISVILKGVPKGTVLYTTIAGDVSLAGVRDDGSIILDSDKVSFPNGLDRYGRFGGGDGECVLFPSRDNRNWERWQRSLIKAGDVVITEDNPEPVRCLQVINDVGVFLRAEGGLVAFMMHNCRFANQYDIEWFEENYKPMAISVAGKKEPAVDDDCRCVEIEEYIRRFVPDVARRCRVHDEYVWRCMLNVSEKEYGKQRDK